MPNLSTQEVDNLLAEEEEFYDAIDEIEHGIGINESMFDWANVNFNSSFGDSGEFNGRASVVQLLKCADCETNSKTIDKQMELLAKSDKQLIESQDKLEESKKKDSKLNEAIDEGTPNAAGVDAMSQEEFDELENNDFSIDTVSLGDFNSIQNNKKVGFLLADQSMPKMTENRVT